MKKLLLTVSAVVTFFLCGAISASALEGDTVRVGLRYGSTALFSANLENAVGSGYAFGYFGTGLDFTPLGYTDVRTISMTASGPIYMDGSGTYSRSASGGQYLGPWHVQLDGFSSFEQAQSTAAGYGGWPGWIDGKYVARVGSYASREEAVSALDRLGANGEVACSSDTGVLVTRTKTAEILFEFDDGGRELGVLPQGGGTEGTATWFKGYRYPGGFAYSRKAGGDLQVVNRVALEDYVRCVVPYEMGGGWPMAALEAQAVCSRTFATQENKHLKAYGFDVCATTDCQVYNGLNAVSAAVDEAVRHTAGELMYYQGTPIRNAVYYSSNGGASEDGYYVWGTETPYLKGKQDPYEAMTSIPNYRYSVTYTADQLTWILQQKGYKVGTVQDVYVAERTPSGNVYKVNFVHSGGTLTVKGDTCRSIFYSSTYQKSVNSLRYQINGVGGPVSGGEGFFVNGTGVRLPALGGLSVISGNGKVTALGGGTVAVCSASGIRYMEGARQQETPERATPSDGTFTITGTGNGHHVGMSQYGAKAMAEQGFGYDEILRFYFTDITIG